MKLKQLQEAKYHREHPIIQRIRDIYARGVARTYNIYFKSEELTDIIQVLVREYGKPDENSFSPIWRIPATEGNVIIIEIYIGRSNIKVTYYK